MQIGTTTIQVLIRVSFICTFWVWKLFYYIRLQENRFDQQLRPGQWKGILDHTTFNNIQSFKAQPLNSSTETLLLDVSDSTRFSGLLTREFVRTYQAFRSPSTAWNNQKAATYEVKPPFQPNESDGKK